MTKTQGGCTPPFFVLGWEAPKRGQAPRRVLLHTFLLEHRRLVNPAQQQIADRVRELTEEVITGTSYFLVDVQVRGHQGTRVVEVYIDSADEFGHDDIAVVSKELGFLLDVEDILEDSYKLEVSSPGIKRPLTMPQQYQKNVGRTLRVRYEQDSTEEIVVGDLMDATDERVELELSSGERLELPYQSITQARVELPW